MQWARYNGQPPRLKRGSSIAYLDSIITEWNATLAHNGKTLKDKFECDSGESRQFISHCQALVQSNLCAGIIRGIPFDEVTEVWARKELALLKRAHKEGLIPENVKVLL